MRRAVREDMSSGGPPVVEYIWSTVHVANLVTNEGTIEAAQGVEGCNIYKGCKGHLCVSPSGGSYLILYGFAVEGELVSSNGSLLNQNAITGKKKPGNVATYYFMRVSGKWGS